MSDPDARPIRKGKLGKPTEFGYVAQIAEVTENTRRGARGFILPAATPPGNPAENTLLPETDRRARPARAPAARARLDGGFQPGADPRHRRRDHRACSSPAATSRLAAHHASAKRATAPAARAASATSNAATACAAADSKATRPADLDRLGILAYNLDTLAIRTA